MRKYTAILLVFLSCNLLTELHEVYFLPSLFSHYQLHLKTEKISFLDFIQLHYADNSHATSEEHTDLPFKHKTTHFFNFTVYFTAIQATDLSHLLLQPLLLSTSKVIGFYQVFFGTLRLISIWHPPCF